MKTRKSLTWIGSSKKDLLALPKAIQSTMGYAINLAQQGKTDDDAKTFKGFGGRCVMEIVKEGIGGTFRAVYVAKFKEAVYVLHVFQKKSKSGIKTPKQDVELIKKRFQEALRQHELFEKNDEIKNEKKTKVP